ncbi:MAG TPA: sigma-70 family RNA polymerase sigma factor [Flavitalea sp.]|nr:sigma-70 family RNA polymerase sigma factor [Flavitalea sp.]
MTEKEFNQCVTDHADGVFRFILKNLRHVEDARDIVQSAFEKMWVNHATVDGTRGKSFLFTVAYHQMIDHIRKKKMVIVNEEMAVERTTDARSGQETRKILEKALYRLNETQRSLVMLKDYEGYSYEEIGEITGLNPSQVKVYLHRARQQLKSFLGSPENILES